MEPRQLLSAGVPAADALTSTHSGIWSKTLTFDEPIAGTILDVNSFGTGFTHRLPGTGAALPASDPNLLLNAGRLAVTSTQTEMHPPGVRYEIMEAPGLLVPNVGAGDITISALFRNVQVNEWSDQLEVYAGTSATNNVRAGFHKGGEGSVFEYIFSDNRGSDWGENPYQGAGNYANGDDVLLTLRRESNRWSLAWQNLTNGDSGWTGSYIAPWLDGAQDLYVGVFYASPRSPNLETTALDSLSVEVVSAEIHGTKYNDLDGDGVKEPGEPGLPDWKIYLDYNQNGQWDNGEEYQTTDADGNYAFLGLAGGTYTVAEEYRSGWTRTSPAAGDYALLLQRGEVRSDVNFGNWQPAEIRGSKWNDLDGDGVRDRNEPGLAGWTVYLDLNNNGILDDGEPSQITAADGSYAFHVVAGTYTVLEVPRAGWQQTSPASDRATLLQTFHNPNGSFMDGYGSGLAAVGQNILVGAYLESVAYLFDPRTGALKATIPAPPGGDRFGFSAVALNDHQFAVSAYWDDANGANSGAVYLFNYDGTAVTPMQIPVYGSAIPGEAAGDHFGYAGVAAQGDLLVVGGFANDFGVIDAGSAYIINLSTGARIALRNPTPNTGDEFGHSVAIVGDRVFVGAPNAHVDGVADSGAVFIFDTAGNYLGAIAKPQNVSGDRFGFSVAAEGTKVLIGAEQHPGQSPGYAYLFDTATATGTLIPNPRPHADDRFGVSVAMVLGNALVGAQQDHSTASGAGAAYLFDGTTGTLLKTYQKSNPQDGDLLGWPVAAYGNNVLIGAVHDNLDGPWFGAAYLFSGAGPDPRIVTVASGELVTGVDFGNHMLPGEIRGTTWNDLDGDGTRDTAEPVLVERIVYLDYNQNGQWDNGEASQTTDASGNFAFTGLAAGTYTVAEVLPSGWTPTSPAAGNHAFVLQPGQTLEDINFGNWQPSEIRGTKWNDLDGDGIRDEGEPGLPGWTIYLDLNNDGILQQTSAVADSTDAPKAIPDVSTVTSQLSVSGVPGALTDLNMTLAITHTWDSDLDVFLISPSGTRVELFTDVGGNGGNFTSTTLDDEAATDITSGASPFTGSFRPEGSLALLKGEDANGIWTLEITDDSGGDVGTLNSWSLAMTYYSEPFRQTGAEGDYSFNGLAPGSYVVRAVLQSGWTQTVPAAGSHEG